MRAPPHRHWRPLLFLPGLLGAPPSIAPQQLSASQDPVRISRIETPVVVDGRLDDAAWAGAAVLSGFVQTQPGDNAAPSYPTTVRVAWDDAGLYFGIVAKDTPRHIRATVTRR